MDIRWSSDATSDFAGIVQYIRQQNQSAADQVALSIYDGISSLTSFPMRGKTGRVAQTRELILTPFPFIVVYRLKSDIVEIVRVLHGSQRWP